MSDQELEIGINAGLNPELTDSRQYDINATPIYIAEKNRRSAEKYSKTTLLIVKLALFISLVALSFAIIDFLGDKSWRNDQLKTLQKIEKNTRINLETEYQPI